MRRAVLRQREAQALDGRAERDALVEETERVLEEALPARRREGAADQLARGAPDLQVDVLLARIEVGEGVSCERRVDAQRGFRGAEAGIGDRERLRSRTARGILGIDQPVAVVVKAVL